jgi:hypothetical protein
VLCSFADRKKPRFQRERDLRSSQVGPEAHRDRSFSRSFLDPLEPQSQLGKPQVPLIDRLPWPVKLFAAYQIKRRSQINSIGSALFFFERELR